MQIQLQKGHFLPDRMVCHKSQIFLIQTLNQVMNNLVPQVNKNYTISVYPVYWLAIEMYLGLLSSNIIFLFKNIANLLLQIYKNLSK